MQSLQPKVIAILGSTASGKTSLSLELAQKYRCAILSLDSLSIYKEINIASAKPSLKERGEIPHFGLDVLMPSEAQNVQNFITEYHKAWDFCIKSHCALLIVGGSGFYLRTLLSGLSAFPKLSTKQRDDISSEIKNLGGTKSQYDFLYQIDSVFAKSIKSSDTYRIRRALEIYYVSQEIPSVYFKKNPPKPILKHCEIVEILWERNHLRERIRQRTDSMIKQGLIDEVKSLIVKYGTEHQWGKSVGIKETLEFLDSAHFTHSTDGNKQNLKSLCDSISTHTAQLAKRQRTFNKTQFPPHAQGTLLEIQNALERLLS